MRELANTLDRMDFNMKDSDCSDVDILVYGNGDTVITVNGTGYSAIKNSETGKWELSHTENEPLFGDEETGVWLVGVQYLSAHGIGKTYTYTTIDGSIRIGNAVSVPVGIENRPTEAVVVSMEPLTRDTVTKVPRNALKRVFRKLDPDELGED